MKAGTAVREFTPGTSQFLWGYPHVPRMSEGVHDPLLSSALYLEHEDTRVLFIANDILFLTTVMVKRIRSDIAAATGVPAANILLSATHTHSAPRVEAGLFPDEESVAPPVDQAFVARLTRAATQAGIAAVETAVPARLGFARADATGIGTNRHAPDGPADHEVPVLAARALDGEQWIGVMYVCTMHPTVLHQDSRLVSADFPWATRRTLQAQAVGSDCPVLHHMGCAGNQSARHVTRANTFAEADRVGTILGAALVKACGELVDEADPGLKVVARPIDPPRKVFAPVAAAEQALAAARRRFEELKRTGPATEARTAECDVFGAEARLALSGMAETGALEPVYASATPVELQGIRVGDWCYAAWPSETYVEYGLAAKQRCPGTFIITNANGRLPGYITTPKAVAAGDYEAGAALFTPEAGQLYIDTTAALVEELRA